MLDCRRGGDGGSRLFERYRDPVWRFFRRRVADAAVAEELAQDVFAALLAAAPRYEPRAPFRSYLFGIAYNVLMAYQRRAWSVDRTAVDPDTLGQSAPDPDDQLWLRKALGQLEAADREVLMLREYEQLSYQEIAELQRIPLNTVRSRLFRARLALRDALMPAGDGEPR
jgi:RNA polymerase sigma-70 factor (ECF subfamily)